MNASVSEKYISMLSGGFGDNALKLVVANINNTAEFVQADVIISFINQIRAFLCECDSKAVKPVVELTVANLQNSNSFLPAVNIIDFMRKIYDVTVVENIVNVNRYEAHLYEKY